jgi:endonuclease III
MAINNRAALINQTIKIVKKHFKPASVPRERTLLEHFLFACCLENSPHEAADRIYHTLVTDYYDWNEVRVSTIRELAEVMKPLNDPEDAATRLKRILQAVFETHYSFDLEPLKKQNIGQSAKQLAAYNGSTPFSVAFVTQHALGGHSIPVNPGLLESLRVVGVVSDAEAAKGTIPGLERAVPKTKGGEIASLLHQLGVEMARSPYGQTIRKILLEINPDCKDQLPKRQAPKQPEPEPAPPPPVEAPPQAKGEPKAAGKKSKKSAPAAAEKNAEKATEKPSPPKTAPQKGTAVKGTAEKGTAEKGTAEKATAEKVAPEKASADTGTAKKSAAKKPTAKKKADSKPGDSKPAPSTAHKTLGPGPAKEGKKAKKKAGPKKPATGGSKTAAPSKQAKPATRRKPR